MRALQAACCRCSRASSSSVRRAVCAPSGSRTGTCSSRTLHPRAAFFPRPARAAPLTSPKAPPLYSLRRGRRAVRAAATARPHRRRSLLRRLRGRRSSSYTHSSSTTSSWCTPRASSSAVRSASVLLFLLKAFAYSLLPFLSALTLFSCCSISISLITSASMLCYLFCFTLLIFFHFIFIVLNVRITR